MTPIALTSHLRRDPGYAVLGLVFIPIIVAFAAPALLWSGPSCIHRSSMPAQRLHHLPVAAEEPPVPPLMLLFIVNGSALGVAVTVMLFYVEHVLLAPSW